MKNVSSWSGHLYLATLFTILFSFAAVSSATVIASNTATTPAASSASRQQQTGQWNYSCPIDGAGTHVEIVGIGMGSRFSSENPQTLSIPDVSSIERSLAQVIARKGDNYEHPESVIVSSALESHTFDTPTSSDDGYFYEVFMQPTDEITAQVNGEGTRGNKTPRALVAYLFRSGGNASVSGTLVHTFVYKTSHTEVLSIAPAPDTRDVDVTFVLADKADDGRRLFIHAEAGGILRSETITHPNRGNELVIYTLTLPKVPGDVSTVTVTLESPVTDGDSVIWSGLNVTVQCPPAPTPTSTATTTPTPVPAETATPAPTETPTSTSTPTTTPVDAATATSTATASPTATGTPTPTNTPQVAEEQAIPTATTLPATPTMAPEATPTQVQEQPSPTPVPEAMLPEMVASPAPITLPVTGDATATRVPIGLLVVVGVTLVALGAAVYRGSLTGR